MLRRLLVLLCAIPLLLAAASSANASIPPHYRIGTPDLNAYCASRGDTAAVLDGPTAYDWHCVTSQGARSRIYFDVACQQQYGQGNTTDRIENFYDPTSVSCWRVASLVYVPPNLAAYCQRALHHDGVVLTGATVYDWHCVDYSRAGASLYGISMPDVCIWSSGGYRAVDRFVDFYAPNSWRCFM
ncbi:hypothetical protein [Kitasatospora sp. GAS204B]|uniref:hypothetical protein n=1 Tax=unclassified Kitasatospora TaxID=2633591 RepID=UPI0024769FD3|nr:hypothetical protein [Kitasatospora sp. GAS204B]MDH6122694.1 hypothetical protein [Kitasatospora sp. GAS204B]